jgi:hypothetical protein
MTLFDPWPESDVVDRLDRAASSTARPVEARARARRSDPTTSHEAAASVTIRALNASQEVALLLLRWRGPSTLEELVDEARARELALSDSRIRSAAAELVALDLVHDTGARRPTRSRRTGRVLALGPAPTKEQHR